MGESINEYIEYACEVAEEAGKLITDAIKKEKRVLSKSSELDFVTETDQAVEELIIGKLTAKFPSHRFIGEESAQSPSLTDAPTWIIDPIDGTMDFVHGNPVCCVSIGLAINKQIKAGVIYNPNLKLMFTAKEGQGAYLNGERIHVRGETDLSRALIGIEVVKFPTERRNKFVLDNFNSIFRAARGTRSWAAAAMDLAAVAAGWIDGYYDFWLGPWDFAAGTAIVREAGGVVTDPSGGELNQVGSRVMATSSQKLTEALAKQLRQDWPTDE